jgi:hypothetical protein
MPLSREGEPYCQPRQKNASWEEVYSLFSICPSQQSLAAPPSAAIRSSTPQRCTVHSTCLTLAYERSSAAARGAEPEKGAEQTGDQINRSAVRQITKFRVRVGVAVALATVALVTATCGRAVNSVRVEPGLEPLRPVFALADSTGRSRSGLVYGLSVVPCGGDSAAWQIGATGSKGPPQRVTYGETPDGFVTLVGPQPLRSGCYDVFVTDGRRARFRVDAQGRVNPEHASPPDTSLHDNRSGHVRPVNRAMIGVGARRAERA